MTKSRPPARPSSASSSGPSAGSAGARTAPARGKQLVARARAAAPARAARARSALTAIRGLLVKAAETTWDLGHALAEFAQDKLFVALGYASFEECLAGERLISSTQAYRLIRIARHFSRDELATLGSVEKADALITYAEATDARDTPAGLLKADALVGQKRVSKAGASDLESAAKTARARRTSDPADSRNAARAAKAKADLAREKRLVKHLKAHGLAPSRVATKGARVVVELDVATVDALLLG